MIELSLEQQSDVSGGGLWNWVGEQIYHVTHSKALSDFLEKTNEQVMKDNTHLYTM